MSSQETRYFKLSNFTFNDGTNLPVEWFRPGVRIAYRILNPDKTKVAVVHTCFRGRLDTTLTYANGALADHKIILIALFGNGESSSPSNTPDFPRTLDYQDCVRAQHELLTERLRVRQVDVMLGFSMGGQMTYHWIATHPKFVKNAVIVCSSARTSRHNFQFLEGPRAALENAASPERGVRAFAKAYSAWLTSAEWFEQEMYKELGHESLAAWDETTTGSGYDGWAGEDLLVMLGMWQRGDITRCVPSANGDLDGALKSIEARVLLMPCLTDQYFRPYVNEKECKALQYGTCEVVPSIWGHIAGAGANTIDVKWMDQKIHAFLHET